MPLIATDNRNDMESIARLRSHHRIEMPLYRIAFLSGFLILFITAWLFGARYQDIAWISAAIFFMLTKSLVVFYMLEIPTGFRTILYSLSRVLTVISMVCFALSFMRIYAVSIPITAVSIAVTYTVMAVTLPQDWLENLDFFDYTWL